VEIVILPQNSSQNFAIERLLFGMPIASITSKMESALVMITFEILALKEEEKSMAKVVGQTTRTTNDERATITTKIVATKIVATRMANQQWILPDKDLQPLSPWTSAL